jgi:hypothetical protein
MPAYDGVMPADLPISDGPLVRLRLPDGQQVYATARARVREGDGSWWYAVTLSVETQGTRGTALVVEPWPVQLMVPADRCEQVPGQEYGRLETLVREAPPDWLVERLPPVADPDDGPARMLHRGACPALGGAPVQAVPVAEALALVRRPDVAACTVCRPEQRLR